MIDRTKVKKILLEASYPRLPLDDSEFVKAEIIKGRGERLRAHSLAWLCRHPKIAKILDLQSWKAQLEQPFMILPALRKEAARVKILAKSALLYPSLSPGGWPSGWLVSTLMPTSEPL